MAGLKCEEVRVLDDFKNCADRYHCGKAKMCWQEMYARERLEAAIQALRRIAYDRLSAYDAETVALEALRELGAHRG